MNRKIHYMLIFIAFIAFGTWYCVNYGSIKSVHSEKNSDMGKDYIDKTEFSTDNIISEYHETININTANETELSSIDGIGPKRAAAIVEYRNKNGNFKNIEDIKNISGIGEGTFNMIKKYITV